MTWLNRTEPRHHERPRFEHEIHWPQHWHFGSLDINQGDYQLGWIRTSSHEYPQIALTMFEV
jgi:xylose isomerase